MRTIILILAIAFTGAFTPATAQKAHDYLGHCVPDGSETANWCKASLDRFEENFRLAIRGDYDSQRNVAYCLSTGCDGAVKRLPITGCAWRIAIVGIGSKDVDQSDTDNLKDYCGKLDAVEREAAAVQAARLITKIGAR